MTSPRATGFTLVEMLAVVVIVTLLLVLTLPSYQRHRMDLRRALASATLLEAMIRQEQFFVEHKRYASRLTDLNYPAHPFAIDGAGSMVSDEAADRSYVIGMAVGENTYTLTATPQLGNAADPFCGTLSLDDSGVKRASGQLPARECW